MAESVTENLNISLVQLDIEWHKPEANRRRIDQLLAEQPDFSADLVVLPEMFTTGFTMSAQEFAEPMDGATVQWMTECAARFNAVVTGTVAVKEAGHFYNRLLWVKPDGDTGFYDKRHLFRMAQEHLAYRPGSLQPTFDLKGWRIRPIICYDLRFPVWCRAKNNDYDALLCPANWPDPRHNAWLSLLTARAIENQAYMIANNRVGTDAHGKHYLGNSQVIDPKGHALCDAGSNEKVVTTTLSKQELDRFRTKFPISVDADEFDLKP
ncbi:MAG: amidohydrolase [Gammaproteobacteria bacterium]